MKRIAVGILAHVDSGKTTLSEAMMYRSGNIGKLGRVDHKDSFLDTNALERERGITIFSKQAVLNYGDAVFYLLDTPGHVDFSAETERTLQVLDYAVLVISGTDGVQSHTATLWKLLRKYRVPCFLFVNKMDLPGADRQFLLNELRGKLSDGCVDFTDDASEAFFENLALCSDALFARYENGTITPQAVAEAIAKRQVFPCLFGSALRQQGVDEFLEKLNQYTQMPRFGADFGALVYKIAEDAQGNRLTFMKITGGTLKVKAVLPAPKNKQGEKVNQIRIYSGEKYTSAAEAAAGTVCAVTGVTFTRPGDGLGAEPNGALPVLEPVLTYRVELPKEIDAHTALAKLKILEAEDPQLNVVWDERLAEIQVQLMGEIQLEVLRRIIQDRFGFAVDFGQGNIIYKETIAAAVEGVGHFEPLRHYAEVHLLLKPGKRDSGLVFGTDCREDLLDKNWQRLILTHSAESILLEPIYEFTLELPAESLGRAMNDIQRMSGSFEPPEQNGDAAVLSGTAPVSEMRDYATELTRYTHGKGRLSCTLKGYAPCHNAEEVIERIGYQPDADLLNPCDSVFCAHGAGYVVKWDDVKNHMHLSAALNTRQEAAPQSSRAYLKSRQTQRDIFAADKELMRIFEATYGPVKKRAQPAAKRKFTAPQPSGHPKRKPAPAFEGKEYVLVDGYNVIFASDALKEMTFDGARDALINILCNYQGFKKCEVIVVFDAYKVKGGVRSVERVNDISVVYTQEAETADMYIEKTSHQLAKNNRVRVVTSDGLEQLIILGNGALRVPSAAFWEEIREAEEEIRQIIAEESE